MRYWRCVLAVGHGKFIVQLKKVTLTKLDLRPVGRKKATLYFRINITIYTGTLCLALLPTINLKSVWIIVHQQAQRVISVGI